MNATGQVRKLVGIVESCNDAELVSLILANKLMYDPDGIAALETIISIDATPEQIPILKRLLGAASMVRLEMMIGNKGVY